jgi:fructose-bisphosphate aldolase class II
MLEHAEKHRYAVGGFNITSLETALGIFEAGEKEKSPYIFQISEKTIDYMGLDVSFAIAKSLADRSDIPIAIHFDHGRNYPLIEDALKIGFSSVMVDVSHEPKQSRIGIVQELSKKAHKYGATIEVEEDSIAGREDYVKGRAYTFTDPKRAYEFVKMTEADLLAVSIGNSHGKPLEGEELHLDLLSKIDRLVSVPLVLHGASSTSKHIIREVIARGVRKINIDTDLRLAFTKSLRQNLIDHKEIYDPRDELKPTIKEVRDTVIDAMRDFGSSGKV